MKTNREEIEEIYSAYSRQLFLASLRILGDRQEAEDVMQDTILKVCTDHNVSKINNIGAYLTRSCVNKSLDIIRKHKTIKSYMDEQARDYGREMAEDEQSSVAEEEKNKSGLVGKIIGLIARLPRNCRQIVSLKLIEGYDYEEIAEITSMKDSTIRSSYMRGRQRLADLMKKEGIYE